MFHARIYNIFSERYRDTSSDNAGVRKHTRHIYVRCSEIYARRMERAVVAIVPSIR